MQDESLHDATIPVDDAEDIMVEYYMVDSGTERGKRKLVDSTGFSYTVKKQKNDHVLWRCTKWSKTINCPATIIQDGDDYRPGQKQHIHAGDPGSHIALRIKAEVKQQAKDAKFEERSSSIVEKAITAHGDISAPAGSRPNPGYLIRTANRVRQMDRPKDPSDLHDEVGYIEKIITNVIQ
uniref:FLYWCH-type domain-containing protein n=1 Tax=Magallana gigas TaxID=29159 RepID=K1QHJ6_MAGGI